MANSTTNRRFRLLYDGACPICRREVEWLKRRDRSGNLQLEDISARGFDPARYGLTRESVDSVLHGIRQDGVVVRGMEAIREAYRSVGLGWLTAATRLPGLKWAADRLYGWFARNRTALGRFLEPRCREGECTISRDSRTSESGFRPRAGRCRLTIESLCHAEAKADNPEAPAWPGDSVSAGADRRTSPTVGLS
jgi:predicted DCC family thiol-disulfide oxidoreductase YuxK